MVGRSWHPFPTTDGQVTLILSKLIYIQIHSDINLLTDLAAGTISNMQIRGLDPPPGRK